MPIYPKGVVSAWTDNMGLDTLNAARALNQASVGSTKSQPDDHFWSTPERFSDSEIEESMEITLSSVQLVNHLTFDVVRFPHDCFLEYYDEDDRDWFPLRHHDTDDECVKRVDECSPQVLPPASSMGDRHPQHSFADHWEGVEFQCRPTRFRRMRFVCKRHQRCRQPRNPLGALIAYSLALRSVYCGYRVDSLDCVPAPQPTLLSSTITQSFSSTTDALGSGVNFSLRTNPASNILLNDPATADASTATLVWKCEPQPYPWNVVNFYADVRDADGNPQLLDRFFLDPLYNGPNVNLYYSNDEPTADFKAVDLPLPSNVAVINGQISGTNILSSDTQTYGTVAYIDVDNTGVCFNPGRRWWFGAGLSWKFLRGIDTDDHPIFDCGSFHLSWTRFGLRFRTRHGDEFHVDCDDFNPATDFRFIVWHDPDLRRCHTRIHCNGRDYEDFVDLTVALEELTVSRLRYAGFLDDLTKHSDFKLHHHVLKIDQEVTEELVEDFFHDPTPYCVRAEFRTDDDGRTDNALLRYTPTFATPSFPSGIKGGGPTRYDALSWSPVARDYTLNRGFLQFNPTKAKYWKFEFCGLVPEPYEVYVPIKKTVKTYTTQMWSIPVYPRDLDDDLHVLLPGCRSQIQLSATISYSDNRTVTIGSSVRYDARGYTNTTVRIVQNTVAAAAVAAVSWAWSFLPCHKPVRIPVFETTSVHVYDEIDVQQSSKTAFFVGLKSIAAYSVNYVSLDDTNQYIELFHDTANLAADSGWVLAADHELSSGDTQFAQATSRPFASNRVVRALQFATTQSAPLQLLPDDDFGDVTHAAWDGFGDGTLAPFTTVDDVRVGSTLRVDRSSRNPSWLSLESAPFGTWGAFDAQSATFLVVENSGNPSQAQGGITSAGVTVPPGGRVYAAARVVAPVDLSSPLFVQIVDDATGRVLAETESPVAADQITEWYTGYTIGEGGTILAWRWSDFSTNPAYPSYLDTFAHPNGATLPTMDTKQAWLNTGTSHSISSLQAVTSTAGAYDYVDTVTPWGTLEVTIGAMGTGAAAALLRLGILSLDDQGVLSYIGGRSAMTSSSAIGRAVQSGDDIRIDILPTSQVASNRRDSTYPDNVSAPYSAVFTLNGTWIKTVAHRLGSRTLRGILGRLNQHFTSFSWTPASFGPLPGPTLFALPVVGWGGFDVPRLTWTDIDGNIWATTGSVDNATVGGVLCMTANATQMIFDSRYWYGTLHAGVRHVATGYAGAPNPHGFVLCLDADLQVYLDYAGNLVQVTPTGNVNQGALIPGGVANGAFVSVQFLDTKSVDVSVKGAISATTFPRMLVARVNGAVVGTYASAFLQTWTSTKRGLAGDAYNPGVDGSGNPNPLPGGTTIDQLHTSFDSFGWAPDASNTVLDPKNPTWTEISQKATGTYDSISHYLTLVTSQLRARVVQKNSSIDIWDMDALSLFADPIVWSFSNDGGQNFYNAFDIRNHPHGVLQFPVNVTLTASSGPAASGSNPGQALRWSVVSYAPNQKVSSLVIRPWYGGLLSGITHRVGLATGGPNTMPFDHYPPIENDARFQVWNKPIPQDWFWAYQMLSRTRDQVLPDPQVLVANEQLISKYKNEVV